MPSHGIVGRRLGIAYKDFCRSCNDEQEEDATELIFCHCTLLLNLCQIGDLDKINSLTYLEH